MVNWGSIATSIVLAIVMWMAGIISSADSTDHTSGTTWYVYAR